MDELLTCECGSPWWTYRDDLQLTINVARGAARPNGEYFRAPASFRRRVLVCAACGLPAPEPAHVG